MEAGGGYVPACLAPPPLSPWLRRLRPYRGPSFEENFEGMAYFVEANSGGILSRSGLAHCRLKAEGGSVNRPNPPLANAAGGR